MTEHLFTPLVQAKGRNPFKSDALRIETLKGEKGDYFTYFENRVASTGNYNMGWLCIPAQPALLREIAAKLNQEADKREAAAKP